ncbi:NAD(P)-binding protein [Aspergillus indologenus CBS 114.80]|uniref:NAD(P)-binding protein n=1 Tax=Aspergillus indologenus CBS 114.80 TaxID=1450541 RepID=A0A2V5I8V6_9EURO|nr:NAD(P)-binding protein [Aspergillus indologenus CBS 114.80]
MTSYTVRDEEFVLLQGKTILIVGGTTGIGRAMVELAVARGARVAIGDWNPDARALEALATDRVLFQQCDVSQWVDVLSLFEAAHARFGTIHAVVSNAGINTHEDLLVDGCDPATGGLQAPSIRSLEVNLIGQLYVARCALHFFARWPDTRCQLVMTSSAGAFFPAPPLYQYCAAKAGVLGLMRALRSEVIKRNVSVNVVAPWLTVTPMLLPEWLETWGALPKNSSEGVARVLLLPLLRPNLNGKSFFVAGDRAVELEESLERTQPQWMGEELCAQVRKGQRLLLGLESPEP